MNSSFELIELGWRNLLSTGNQFTIIPFDETTQFTLVTGNSGDGKTTMMDALSLCWYGKALRPINKPALVNSINGKECEVYTVFRKFSHHYKITRGIKPNFLKVEKDGEEIELPAGEEQEVLDEILGVSYKLAKHVVLLSNASYVPFMQMSAKERREVVEELRELHIFTEMSKLAKTEIDTTNKSLSTVINEISNGENQKILLEKFIRESTAIHTERIDQVNQHIRNLHSEIDTLNIEATKTIELGKQKKTLLVGCEEETERVSTLRASKIRLEERNRTLKSSSDIGSIEKCPTCFQIVSDDHKHDISIKAKTAIESNNAKLVLINNEIEELLPKIESSKSLEHELQSLRNEVSTIQTKVSMHKKTIEGLEKELVKLQMPQQGTTDHLEQFKNVCEGVDKGSEEKSLLETSIKILQDCQKHLKDDGIKASLVEEFIPTFNALVNEHLDRMGFFVQFELDRDFNETIKSRHRDVFTYYSFSEGEKQRIDLALLFAWRELSVRSGLVLPNILFLDEVFDSSLDPETSDRVIDILTDMKEQTNIVCISHNNDIPPVFNRVLKFTKQKNYSVMTDIKGD